MTGNPPASKSSTHRESQLRADGHTSSQPYIQSEKQTRVSGDKDAPAPQELMSIDTAASDIHSTPPKLRRGAVTNTHPSIDPDFANDVTYNTSRNIPVLLFLRIAFGIEKPAFKKLTNEIKTWDVLKSERFEGLLDEFEDADLEKEMYKPFLEMGNIILDYSEKRTPDAKKVHLVNSTGRALEGGSALRYPDLLLVPKREDTGAHLNQGSLSEFPPNHVDNVLVPLEFKFPKEIVEQQKRSYKDNIGVEIDEFGIAKPDPPAPEEETEEEEPPAKLQKTSQAALRASQPIADSLFSADLYSRSEAGAQEAAKRAINRTYNHGRLQLAQYAAELLNGRGERSHVFGVRVNKGMITLTFYHRSAIIEAEPFKLRENPSYLALFLTRFQQDPSTYGFNTAIGFHDPFDVTNERTRSFKADLQAVPKDDFTTLEQDLDLKNITAGGVVKTQNCLIGRGTSVRDISIPGIEDVELVMKCSWQVVGRDDECDNITKARKVIGRHAPEVYARGIIPHSSVVDDLVNGCRRPAHTYEPRELRIIVMKKYKPLSALKSGLKFRGAVIVIARCLHKLFVVLRMLHQDISINNLAYCYVDGEFTVVILDFDLASTPTSARHVSNHRTGTVPFMAREILDTRYSYIHNIYHDLESLFYCLVWFALGYRWKGAPRDDPLRSWRRGSASDMWSAKRRFIESEDAMRKTLKSLDTEEWAIVTTIWDCYNKAYEKKRPSGTNRDEIAKQATEARDDALKAGLSPEKAGEIYSKTFQKLFDESYVDPTILKGYGITYKAWMLGAGIEVPAEELKCSCCTNSY